MAQKKKSTKKCPECFTYLPINATVCDSCNIKVGPADDGGIAKKPTDWKSYIVAFLGFVMLVIFIWYSFLKR